MPQEEATPEVDTTPDAPKPKEEAKPKDDFADIVHDKKNDGPIDDEDDFDNMSDEELEALMAQNDML